MEATALNHGGRSGGQGEDFDGGPRVSLHPFGRDGDNPRSGVYKEKVVRFPIQVPQGSAVGAFPVTAIPILSQGSL